jgi:hypothetical protein
MIRVRTRAAIGVLSAALVLAPVLTSCGQAAEQAAEAAAEQALGGDVEVNDEGVTVTDDEGNQMAIGEDVSLPDNWPSDVPVYEDGTLQMVTVQADGSANAMWNTDASPEDAAKAYGAALESAGYTSESNSNMGGMILAEYTGPAYTVSMQAIEADGTTALMVTAAKPS